MPSAGSLLLAGARLGAGNLKVLRYVGRKRRMDHAGIIQLCRSTESHGPLSLALER